MPQRWEQKLDRLNSLSAPASIRVRIAAGPQGDGPDPSPNRRQRVIAGVVAFALFALALAFAAKAFGGETVSPAAVPDPTAVVLTFSTQTQSGSSYPNATMTFEGAVVQGNGSTFSWNDGNSNMIADTFGTELQFDHWVVLPAGAPIAIGGTADSVHGWVDQEVESYKQPPHLYELPASGAQLPGDSGKYILEFSADWPQGGRTFYFPIKVVSGADVGAAITVQADPGPTASLSYQGVVAPSETAAYCWGNGQSPTCTEGDAGPFAKDQYLEIPQGTAVNVYPSQEVQSYSVALYIGDDPIHQTGPAVSVGNFDSPGSYILILTATWQQGDVQFYFPVRVVAVEAHPAASGSDPAASTEAEPAPSEAVPTVTPTHSSAPAFMPNTIGLGDQGAISMLTQLGFRVQALFRDVPGDEWKVVSSDPAPGTVVDAGSTVTLSIVSRITPPPPGATDALDCPSSEFVSFGSPHVVMTPGGSAYIMNTGGIKLSDNVVPVDPNGEGLWHVVRDGSVIAIVDYQTLDGVACAGSGVAGA